MKKRIYTAAGLFLAAALVLGGCGKEKVPESEFATADEAKEALTSAETIEIYFDLYGSKRKTKIVADGKVAGYLQKNTVYINEEEWFSIDYVEDEPINDREGSGTTYGYYDASGTCLGYAQEQYVDTSYGKDTRLIFLDVDETPLDYQSSRSGRILYDENDEEIGSGKIGRSGVSLLDQWYTNLYCAVFKTETDGARQIDFMDRADLTADLGEGRHLLGTARLKQFLDSRKTLGDIAARNAAGVEGSHRQLRTGLADGLGRDDTDRLAGADGLARGKVHAVALARKRRCGPCT